jgi:hypothetical protein
MRGRGGKETTTHNNRENINAEGSNFTLRCYRYHPCLVRCDTPVPAGEQRYFDGMLYLMSMMHLAGEFRVIDAGRK